MNYSLIFSGCMLLVAVITLIYNATKDRKTNLENNIKTNIKLDNLCNNTNQILVKIEKHDDKIQNIETKMAVMSNDLQATIVKVDTLSKEVHDA